MLELALASVKEFTKNNIIMNISRTPFRISFAGGGSDLPSYYKKYGGAVLSTSINKYIYIAIHPFFDKNKIQLKYYYLGICFTQ